MDKLKKIIDELFEEKISLLSWIFIFLGAIFLRCFIEQFLAFSKPLFPQEYLMEYIHTLLFFSLSIVMIWLFLSLILGIKPEKLSKVLIFSSLFIIFPPLIDMVKTGGEAYWSFYLFSAPRDLFLQYITFFGHLPSAIVYFGTKIVFIVVIFLLLGLIFFKTRSLIKSIATVIGVYSILFLMGAFPSFFFYFYNFIFGTTKFFEIKSFEIFKFFSPMDNVLGINFQSIKYAVAFRLNFIYFILLLILLVILFYAIDAKKFIAVIKNFRYPQVVYHSGLFFIGVTIGVINYPENFKLNLFSILAVAVILVSVWLAWKTSVIINDLNDDKIDAISNPDRPLPQGIFNRKEYTQLGLICFLLSILGGLSLGFPFAFLIIAYQIIAWAYSVNPFRLKRFPLVATLVSSLASLMVLFLGFILISKGQTIHTLSSRIVFLMIISGTLSLPIKDFKDIAGDKKDNIFTIPVIFGEKKSRVIVASGLFISFILSVFFLNELSLFWWAMLFGSFAFLMVVSNKIKPRNIFWPTLGVIFVYGLVMIKVLFF